MAQRHPQAQEELVVMCGCWHRCDAFSTGSHACVQATNSTNILLPEAVAIIRLLEELRGCGHLDQLM